MTREEYIKTFRNYAILTHLLYGVKASITLAQGALESGNGNSSLAAQSKNHFGIKGKGASYQTREEDENGNSYYINAEFKKYRTVLGSYIDHAKLLRKDRYKAMFSKSSAYEWADELQKAGYASAGNYAETLKGIISANELEKYDWMGNHRLLIAALFLLLLIAVAVWLYKHYSK